MSTLEEEFHKAMIRIYEEAIIKCDYHPTYFLSMVTDLGGLQAAKKLLASKEIQSGFTKLYECGRLDLTAEALVTQDKFRSLFEPDELAEAERRLKVLGVK